MPIPLDCPERASWQALFAGTVPADQRQRYERHLESCPACQAHFDRAEDDEGGLLELARQVGDPTTAPPDVMLVQVVDCLLEAKPAPRTAPAEPDDLFFLRPADRPGLLGTLGAYEVEEVIGQGGMGVVLKAYEPALHRRVAIKVLSPALAGSATARRRFTREAQAAAAVCHDHIVLVHGVDESDGLPYLVMQYVVGESLQARLDRAGPLDVVEVVRVGLQTASGLAAAHAQGLIHRDIKPANLLLENGLARVRITDFGLARMTDDVPLTQNDVVAGTPEYMSPEQARGEGVDPRSDLFSLGSVLYTLCTGVPPFRGSNAVAVLRQVSDHAPAPVRSLNPEVPAWLEALVARLMAKDPADRLQSAAEVASLLEAYLAHLQQPTAFPVPPLPPPAGRGGEPPCGRGTGRRLRRYGWPFAVVLAAAALAGALLLQAVPAPDPPTPAGEFYQDFHGGQRPLAPLGLTGSDVLAVTRPEEQGFRITLPAVRMQTDRVGLVLPTRVRGDFEITSGYEILQADRPTEGHGVGFDLFIETDTARREVAEVSRTVRVNEGDVYTCARISTDDDGHRTYHLDIFPTDAKTGRLRLTRHGREVTLLAAEGAAGEFEELCRYDLGTEDVILITDCAYPGFAQNPVDLRIQDLRVHVLGRAGADATASSLAPQRPGRSRGWLAGAGAVGLLILLTALAVCLAASRRRRLLVAAPPGPVKPGPDQAAEAPPHVAFVCPSCGKKLKARPELAGKRLKCPGCGQAVLAIGDRGGQFRPA